MFFIHHLLDIKGFKAKASKDLNLIYKEEIVPAKHSRFFEYQDNLINSFINKDNDLYSHHLNL